MLLVAAWPFAPARAQADVEPGPDAREGHGWLTYSHTTNANAQPTVETIVVHVPPRIAPMSKTAGAVSTAPGFIGGLDARASWGDRVYFVLKPETRPNAGIVRRVLTYRVAPSYRQSYVATPGTPEAIAPLWGDVSIVDVAASGAGVFALVQQDSRAAVDRGPLNPRVGAPGEIMLRELGRTTWNERALPDEPALAGMREMTTGRVRSRLLMAGTRDGVALLAMIEDEGRAALWMGTPERLTLGVTGPPSALKWTRQGVSLADTRGASVTLDGLCFVKGQKRGDDVLVGYGRDGAVLRLYRVQMGGEEEAALVPLTTLEGVLPGATVEGVSSPTHGSGRVLVSWGKPPSLRAKAGKRTQDESASPDVPIQFREVAAGTGEVVYTGPARNSELVSSGLLRLLSGALIGIMVVVIVFVLRADPGRAPVLPASVELASPVRRVLAGLIDYFLGAVAAAQVLGLPTFSLVRWSQIGEVPDAASAVALALAIGMGHSIVAEALFGCSLGKAAMGLRVFAVEAPAAKQQEDGDEPRAFTPGTDASKPDEPVVLKPVRFWQAAARGVVRWAVPILAFMALFDGGRRHPGDLLARTIVVQDRDEAPPEGETES